MAGAVRVLQAVAHADILQSFVAGLEGFGILHRFHEGRILDHGVVVAGRKDEAVIGRADAGGVTARGRNPVEGKAKDLGSALQLELDLDGLADPFIDRAVLPVIDDPVPLVGPCQGVGITKAGVAFVHDCEVKRSSLWNMVAYFHLPRRKDQAPGRHLATFCTFFQAISPRTVLHALLSGSECLGILGGMQEVLVGEAVGAAFAEDQLGFSGIEEPGHVEAGHPVLASEEVDESLTGRALTPLGHPGVIARAAFDEPVEWPGFPSIETHPDPDVFPPCQVRRGRAEEENVSVVPVQSQETGLAPVNVGRAIEKFVILMEIAPGLAAVIAECHPAVSLPGVGAGVKVDRAIAEFGQTGFPGAVEGKGGALVPGLPMVVAVDGVGVALALLMLTVVRHDP